MEVLLVGNPNCGKTTLFNALTGDKQKVGNWPGVTVEKKTGVFQAGAEEIHLTDLPGIYSLALFEQGGSIDAQIAAVAIAATGAQQIINVVDACHLERHLYLTSQLLERGLPLVLALNMSDIALQRGIKIDTQALSQALGCPVVILQAHKKIGIAALKQALVENRRKPIALNLSLDAHIVDFLVDFQRHIVQTQNIDPAMARFCALRALEGDPSALQDKAVLALFARHPHAQELDIILADARYQKIHQIVQSIQKKTSDTAEHLTAKIDKIVLHRFFAIPLFLGIMYAMFLFAINIGGAFQDFFDQTSAAIFVNGTAAVLSWLHAPQWLIALLANGAGVGINTTLTFVPVIAAMFFFLSFLEISGYMARAAFVVDKAMRVLGLPGKAFVPMIVGFGCNVPAIMAARTMDSARDRLLTVLMAPFMSCSARLAIYAVFVAAFFPQGGQNVVFSLYLLGIVMAVLTGFMLRKTSLRGQASPLVLELPAYHRPSLRRLWRETYQRLVVFMQRAARMIVPICVLLGVLNGLTVHGELVQGDASFASILSHLGQWLTPLFAPMGILPDNWPATVGLMTGMLAKEVVIGTLNTLYAQVGHFSQTAGALDFDFVGAMLAALRSIPENLAGLGSALSNPILASAPVGEMSQSVYGMMAQHFDGKAGAYAYLLFILLYVPCVSTTAVIRQEANSYWMWFSLAWSLLLAYAAAVIFYQAASFSAHPQQSITWILFMLSSVALFVGFLRFKGLYAGESYAATNS